MQTLIDKGDIVSKNLKIESFPNDNIQRVVWGYGATIKNTGTTRVPNVEILLKELLSNNEVGNGYLITQVSVLDLDIVRHHTIWQGNQRLDMLYKLHNYKEDEYFLLDFTKHDPVSISCRTIYPMLKSYFGHIPDTKVFARLQNTKFTQITTNKGICVLVPSLEFFTSVYAPKSKEIREYLMMYNLETTLDNCLKSYKLDKTDYYVGVHAQKMRVDTNEFFLAYGKFNTVSQSRIQKLRASLETSSPYPDRYPDVLPYHPNNLQLKGDGIWLDKTTFLMFRVNDYSLPEEHRVYSMIDDHVVSSATVNGTGKDYILHEKDLTDDELEIDNKHKPHKKNASKRVLLEVGVLNRYKIDYQRVRNTVSIKEVNPKVHDYENTKNISGLSSASSDCSSDSKGTGGIKLDEHNDKTYLNQAEILNMMLTILNQMSVEQTNISDSDDEHVYIQEMMFVTEDCVLSTTQTSTQFRRVLKSLKKKVNRWVIVKRIIDHKKQNVGYRNYILIKILLNNGQCIYLFEIDRKEVNRGYLGLLFGINGAALTQDVLGDLLYGVMKKKGIYDNTSMKLTDTLTYKHYADKDKMIAHLKGKLAIAYRNGLFS